MGQASYILKSAIRKIRQKALLKRREADKLDRDADELEATSEKIEGKNL